MNVSEDNAAESSKKAGGGSSEKDAAGVTQSEVATLWDDLKSLIKNVIETMNHDDELKDITGGLEFHSYTPDKIIVNNNSTPMLSLSISPLPSRIEILSSTIIQGPTLVEEQARETLMIGVDQSGEFTFRSKEGEDWIIEQAVFKILRRFLHAGIINILSEELRKKINLNLKGNVFR